MTSIKLGVIFFVIFPQSRKSLTVNDLGGPGPRKPLIANDLELFCDTCPFFLVFCADSVIIVVMKETVKVLMSRDGLTQAEAVKQVIGFFKTMETDIKEHEGSPSDWENEFVREFGLEPDYFEDFIFRLA